MDARMVSLVFILITSMHIIPPEVDYNVVRAITARATTNACGAQYLHLPS